MPDVGGRFRGKKIFLVCRKKNSIVADGSKERKLPRSMTTAAHPVPPRGLRPSPLNVDRLHRCGAGHLDGPSRDPRKRPVGGTAFSSQSYPQSAQTRQIGKTIAPIESIAGQSSQSSAIRLLPATASRTE